MSKQELLSTIDNLYDKYEKNPIIFNKYIQYIQNLPELLENTNTTIIERAKRKNKLETESELFIQKFLHNYNFYYHTSSELFIQYRDNKYYIIKEDDVQYTILSTISANKTLMDWKQKLKVSILKKIKERDIFSCIPESETIQSVLNHLCPYICTSKEKAKYFLTIIGDILHKKTSFIYFLNPKTKPFLKELSNLSCMLFCTPNFLNFFKFKYYEHTFTECRITDIQENMDQNNWNVCLKQENVIDLFCVAAHYSTRYENADNFLKEHCKDVSLISYSLYLKNNKEEEIIDHFSKKSIENSIDCSISWKNMQYLWKQFIETEKLPNVFFTTTLKNILIKKYKYDESKDTFIDCTSKLLPTVSKFIHFWNDNIEHNTDNIEELEIEELCSLFTYHTKTNISEKNILDLIKHYYPDVYVEDDKYLLNICCKLWKKKEEIMNSIRKYKLLIGQNDNCSDEISINELYQIYCGSKNKFTASKKYFEIFFKEEYELYIVDNNFIKVNSFENII